MNDELLNAILCFFTVMLLVNLVKDVFIRKYRDRLPVDIVGKSYMGWWVLVGFGLYILIELYGRAGP